MPYQRLGDGAHDSAVCAICIIGPPDRDHHQPAITPSLEDLEEAVVLFMFLNAHIASARA
jgi:hypothetical protein